MFQIPKNTQKIAAHSRIVLLNLHDIFKIKPVGKNTKRFTKFVVSRCGMPVASTAEAMHKAIRVTKVKIPENISKSKVYATSLALWKHQVFDP